MEGGNRRAMKQIPCCFGHKGGRGHPQDLVKFRRCCSKSNLLKSHSLASSSLLPLERGESIIECAVARGKIIWFVFRSARFNCDRRDHLCSELSYIYDSH